MSFNRVVRLSITFKKIPKLSSLKWQTFSYLLWFCCLTGLTWAVPLSSRMLLDLQSSLGSTVLDLTRWFTTWTQLATGSGCLVKKQTEHTFLLHMDFPQRSNGLPKQWSRSFYSFLGLNIEVAQHHFHQIPLVKSTYKLSVGSSDGTIHHVSYSSFGCANTKYEH